MKALVNWVTPKGVNEGDIYHFRVTEEVTLPILSESDSNAETRFLKGGTVSGTPVLARITDSSSGMSTHVEGILVKETGGVYVIPKKFLEAKPITKSEEIVNDVVKGAEELAKETTEAASKFDTQKTLGFTKKQLLVMAVTMFVFIKILK